MGAISAANLSQKWHDGSGWTGFSSDAAYVGRNSSGSGQDYVLCLRVKMPGTGTGAQFRIRYTFDYGVNSAKKLRWKVTKTGADSTYAGAGGSTAGDGEAAIVQGNGTLTVNYTGSFSAGSYLYVYIWGTDSSEYTLCTVSAVSSHTCSYTEGTASRVSFTGNTIGSPIAIRITRDNAGFAHRLEYSFLGHTGVITSNVGTYYEWTPDPAAFAGWMPSQASGTCTVTCKTYLGAALIGTTTETLTLNLPQSMIPVGSDAWASCAIDNTGTAASALSCGVQGHSKIRVTFVPEDVVYFHGASLESFSVSVQGKTYTATADGDNYVVVTEPIGQSGSVSVVCRCTDSRGRSCTRTLTESVLAYARPELENVEIFRCDGDGEADEEGTFLSLKAEYTASSLGGANPAVMRGDCRTVSGSWQNETVMTSGAVTILGGGLSYATTYIARIRVTDSLGLTSEMETTIPTATAAFHIREGGEGAAFFGYSEKDGELTVYGDIAADNLADTVVETGTVNGWTYRKWQSGILEEWTVTTAAFTWSAWGSLRQGTPGAATIFGVPFTAAPAVQLMLNSSHWVIPLAESVTGTRFSIRGVRPDDGLTTENSYFFAVYAVGRWK